MVGMGDVARAAGVSHGTVSNVLNHPERVSPKSRERVEKVMSDLGFVRNESARQLRSGSSTALGLLLLDTWNPFFNEVTRGIEDTIYASGWSLMVSTSALNSERERINLDSFEQRRLRGVIVVPTSVDSLKQVARMRSRGISCVLLDRATDQFDLPSVSVDDVAGGAVAGQHLLDLGKRRILFTGNPAVHAHAADRLRGLELSVDGKAEVQRFESAAVDIASGLQTANHVLDRDRADWPDAIFCANDLIAIGVLQAFLRAGVSVPDDIALIGYDDIEFSSQVAVPLTTVRQPGYDMGAEAADLILSEISQGNPSQVRRIVHTPNLVIRESTTGR